MHTVRRARTNLVPETTIGTSITANQVMSSGDIAVEGINIDPVQPTPGSPIEIEVTVSETANFVTPGDPALCDPPNAIFPSNGLRGVVTITPDWGVAQQQDTCIEVGTFSKLEKVITFNFVAPQLPSDVSQEEHTLGISVQQPGLSPVETTRSITVTESGFTGPQNGGDEPTGGNGAGGGDGPLGGILQDIPVILVLLIVLVGVTQLG